MASLTLRAGLLQACGDTNVASVAQMIVNRILAGNQREMSIEDLAEALGITLDHVREAMQVLRAKGILDIRGAEIDAQTIAKFRPIRLCLVIEPLVENNLFSEAGMTVEGVPLMMNSPVYLKGEWYRGRFADPLQTKLIIDRGNWGSPWVSIHETQHEDTKSAYGAAIDFAKEVERTDPTELVVRGEPCALKIEERQLDGETIYAATLTNKEGKPMIDTTGNTRDEAMQQMLAWHKARSAPPDDQASGKTVKRAVKKK